LFYPDQWPEQALNTRFSLTEPRSPLLRTIGLIAFKTHFLVLLVLFVQLRHCGSIACGIKINTGLNLVAEGACNRTIRRCDFQSAIKFAVGCVSAQPDRRYNRPVK